MSQLTVTTLSDGSVSVPTNTVVNGSAKAWVNFNGTGTIAARDSFNLSSLTDNATGYYSVNFTSAFATADYAVSGSCAQYGAGGRWMMVSAAILPTGSSYGITCFNNSNVALDLEYLQNSVQGDLA